MWVVRWQRRDIAGLLVWLGSFVRMRREWRDMQLKFNETPYKDTQIGGLLSFDHVMPKGTR